MSPQGSFSILAPQEKELLAGDSFSLAALLALNLTVETWTTFTLPCTAGSQSKLN